MGPTTLQSAFTSLCRRLGFALSIVGAFIFGLSLGLGLGTVPRAPAQSNPAAAASLATESTTLARQVARVPPTVTLALAISAPEEAPSLAAEPTAGPTAVALVPTATPRLLPSLADVAAATATRGVVATATPNGGSALGSAVIKSPEGFNGATLRSAPGVTNANLGALTDGVRVERLVGEATADGFTWAKVRTRDGIVGWVVASLLE